MSEFKKMTSGHAFNGGDRELNAMRDDATLMLVELNQTVDDASRLGLFKRLFAHFGEGSVIRSPFSCEFGKTISIGDNSFINLNVTMLDGSFITLGNNVLVGPNTQFYSASHDLDYRQRQQWQTHCLPIVVEDDVWIGGNAIINQGVTIGARSVIAANSVVTKDVPADCLYGGTPAKLIRHLSENNT
ncbi:sugar O-acetyltransferase [Shewanella sp. 10N.286.52.A9]|uniref:sugar O-acetyltransferase n=1 Tax=Shewanella sp. 10N.286.52.A9 TaxID=3229711 RepID=UPI00354C22B3